MKKILAISFVLLILSGCNNKQFDSTNNDNNVNEKEYYGTQTMEMSWAYEVQDAQKVIDNSQAIVKVKILSLEPGTFEYANGVNGYPMTPINVEVIETLKGDIDLGYMKIYQPGGDVTIKQMIDYYPPEKVEKMGLSNLSNDEINKYTKFIVNDSTELEVNKIYVIALRNGDFETPSIIAPCGYGIFELNDTNSLQSTGNELYKNVLTDTLLDIDDFKEN